MLLTGRVHLARARVQQLPPAADRPFFSFSQPFRPHVDPFSGDNIGEERVNSSHSSEDV